MTTQQTSNSNTNNIMDMSLANPKEYLTKFLNLDSEAFRIGKETLEDCKDMDTMRGNVPKDKTNFKMMVKELNSCFNDKPRFPKKMIIKGGGPACNCHQNSRRVELFFGKDNVESVRGFNFTFTLDGIGVGAEIHSVNKCKKTGEYFDFTTDFGGETTKIFLECDKLKENYIYTQYIFNDEKDGGRTLDYISSFKKKHRDTITGNTFTVPPQGCLWIGNLRKVLERNNFYTWETPPYLGTKLGLSLQQMEYLDEIDWHKHHDINDYDICIIEDEGKSYLEMVNTPTFRESLNVMRIGNKYIDMDELFN